MAEGKELASLMVAQGLRDRLKILAVNLKKTMQEVVELAVEDFLKKNEG